MLITLNVDIITFTFYKHIETLSYICIMILKITYYFILYSTYMGSKEKTQVAINKGTDISVY